MLTSLTIFAALLVAMCAADKKNRRASGQLSELLPKQIGVWMRGDELKLFDRETIFDYINGAGEVYRQYGFHRCVVAQYQAPGQSQLTAEVFDMGSPEDAYGIMSHIREGPEAGYGQGSQQIGSVLHFWQDRYFISIYPEHRTDVTDAAVSAIAAEIVAAIGSEGNKPQLLNLLPLEGLEQRSIRYFHLHPSLNYHYYLEAENILLLDESTDAVLADYDPEDTRLLLVHYPAAAKADQALASFIGSYLPDAGDKGAVETAPGKWTSAAVSGQLVMVVFDAPSDERTMTLVAAVTSKKKRIQP